LENCLQKMANHPVLQLDPDLRTFLESDTLSMEVSFLSSNLHFRRHE
jgi:sorting nexin-1/2